MGLLIIVVQVTVMKVKRICNLKVKWLDLRGPWLDLGGMHPVYMLVVLVAVVQGLFLTGVLNLTLSVRKLS